LKKYFNAQCEDISYSCKGMIIRSASFVKSSVTLTHCPSPSLPEFAFIGRSNVGKSSLINMLTGWSKLARISGQPGKTQTINHFIINDEWYLVDLPGYGYAKVPSRLRDNWVKEVENYIMKRENLVCLFVLLDIRIKPQDSDLGFMEMLGLNQLPFARVFTKTDKLKSKAIERSIQNHNDAMHKKWEYLPKTFISSALKIKGRDELLNYIEESINIFKNSR
jgi:GTP-binding protein